MKLFTLLSVVSFIFWLLIDWRTAVVGSVVLLVPWLILAYIVAILSIRAPFWERVSLLLLGWANPANLAAYAVIKPEVEAFKKKKKKKKHGA